MSGITPLQNMENFRVDQRKLKTRKGNISTKKIKKKLTEMVKKDLSLSNLVMELVSYTR